MKYVYIGFVHFNDLVLKLFIDKSLIFVGLLLQYVVFAALRNYLVILNKCRVSNYAKSMVIMLILGQGLGVE